MLDPTREDRFLDSCFPQDPDRARKLPQTYPVEVGPGAGRERGIRLALDEKGRDRKPQPPGLLENQERESPFTGDEAETLGQAVSRFRLSRA